jgi:hypothetical protein
MLGRVVAILSQSLRPNKNVIQPECRLRGRIE